MDDIRVDSLLREAGSQWRAAQAPLPDAEGWLDRFPDQRQSSLPAVLRAAAVVALVSGGLGIGLMATTPAATSGVRLDWSASDLRAAVVRVGDRVKATGYVMKYPGQYPRICAGGAIAGVGGSGPQLPYACSNIAVPIEGLDPQHIEGVQDSKGVVYTPSAVTISGTWNGTSLVVSSIASAHSTWRVDAPLPCPTPTGGWPPAASSSLALETATRRVGDEITAHPEQFSGYWAPTGLDGSGLGGDVIVVGATTAAGNAEVRLASLYPYGVCIVPAEYSAADLQRTADAVGNVPDDTRRAEIVPQLDRVRVQLTMLDDASATLLAAYPEAVPDPLIIREP